MTLGKGVMLQWMAPYPKLNGLLKREAMRLGGGSRQVRVSLEGVGGTSEG